MEFVEELAQSVREFAEEREWEPFHTPKNLAMAVAGEAGELVAELQWLTDAEIARGLEPGNDVRERLEGEVADVLIYLVRLADVTNIDLRTATRRKLELNARRYPVDKARGSSLKYTKLDS